jgi:hypothetical protein
MPILRRWLFFSRAHPLLDVSLERSACRTTGVSLAFLHYSW